MIIVIDLASFGKRRRK